MVGYGGIALAKSGHAEVEVERFGVGIAGEVESGGAERLGGGFGVSEEGAPEAASDRGGMHPEVGELGVEVLEFQAIDPEGRVCFLHVKRGVR